MFPSSLVWDKAMEADLPLVWGSKGVASKPLGWGAVLLVLMDKEEMVAPVVERHKAGCCSNNSNIKFPLSMGAKVATGAGSNKGVVVCLWLAG